MVGFRKVNAFPRDEPDMNFGRIVEMRRGTGHLLVVGIRGLAPPARLSRCSEPGAAAPGLLQATLRPRHFDEAAMLQPAPADV